MFIFMNMAITMLFLSDLRKLSIIGFNIKVKLLLLCKQMVKFGTVSKILVGHNFKYETILLESEFYIEQFFPVLYTSCD